MTLPLLSSLKRYVVYYEDEETMRVITFGTWAAMAYIATARAIAFIEENKLHKSEGPYYLIPRIDKKKIVNYDI